MNKFRIIEKCHSYSACVLFQTHDSPFSLIEELKNELQSKNIYGRILFDTLFHSGNSKDRFIEVYFDGNEIDTITAHVVKIEKGNGIRKVIAEILKDNYELLEDSILNSVQKKLLSKGISL